jgi:hypothetical protein
MKTAAGAMDDSMRSGPGLPALSRLRARFQALVTVGPRASASGSKSRIEFHEARVSDRRAEFVLAGRPGLGEQVEGLDGVVPVFGQGAEEARGGFEGAPRPLDVQLTERLATVLQGGAALRDGVPLDLAEAFVDGDGRKVGLGVHGLPNGPDRGDDGAVVGLLARDDGHGGSALGPGADGGQEGQREARGGRSHAWVPISRSRRRRVPGSSSRIWVI